MSVPRVVKSAKARRATVDAKVAFRRIGCSDTAGYAAIRRGDLPIVRVGRRVFVPVAALDRLLGIEHDPLEAA